MNSVSEKTQAWTRMSRYKRRVTGQTAVLHRTRSHHPPYPLQISALDDPSDRRGTSRERAKDAVAFAGTLRCWPRGTIPHQDRHDHSGLGAGGLCAHRSWRRLALDTSTRHRATTHPLQRPECQAHPLDHTAHPHGRGDHVAFRAHLLLPSGRYGVHLATDDASARPRGDPQPAHADPMEQQDSRQGRTGHDR